MCPNGKISGCVVGPRLRLLEIGMYRMSVRLVLFKLGTAVLLPIPRLTNLSCSEGDL